MSIKNGTFECCSVMYIKLLKSVLRMEFRKLAVVFTSKYLVAWIVRVVECESIALLISFCLIVGDRAGLIDSVRLMSGLEGLFSVCSPVCAGSTVGVGLSTGISLLRSALSSRSLLLCSADLVCLLIGGGLLP